MWTPEWLRRDEWLAEVSALKTEGKIRAFGLSANDHEPASVVEAVRSGAVDTVQVVYNVFDQSPEDELLPACRDHGVGVVVRVALDEGGLTGAVRPGVAFEQEDWRRQYFRDDRPAQVQQHVQQHVQPILEDVRIEADQLAETALRQVLSSSVVSSVVVGMRSVRNVERNVGDGHGLPEAQLKALSRHRWARNFYA